MNCEICKVNIVDLKQHLKSDKHRENIGEDKIIKKKYNYGGDYQKEYNEYRKIAGKYKIRCETCNKDINRYNLSHHKKTMKHIDKLNKNVIEPFNFEEVQL